MEKLICCIAFHDKIQSNAKSGKCRQYIWNNKQMYQISFWQCFETFQHTRLTLLSIILSDCWLPILFQKLDAVVQRCSVKKVFLEISQNSSENTCTRTSFFLVTMILKKSIFEFQTFLIEHLWTTASVHWKTNPFLAISEKILTDVFLATPCFKGKLKLLKHHEFLGCCQFLLIMFQRRSEN